MMIVVSSVDPRVEFHALAMRAATLMESGDPAWQDALEEARAAARDVGERVKILSLDHYVARKEGDLTRARHHLGEALALVDDADDTGTRLMLLDDLLGIHLLAGDLDQARGVLRLMEAAAGDNALACAMIRNREGDLALATHDYPAAQAAYTEAVDAARPHPDLAPWLGASLVSLATVAVFNGDADTAERFAAQARGVINNVNDRAGLYEVDLGVARIRGDVEGARRIYAEYQRFMAGEGEFAHPGLHAEAAAGAALEAQASGDHDHAAHLYRELAQRNSEPANRALALLRAAAAEWDAGRQRATFQLLDDAAGHLTGSSYLTLRASIEVYRALFLGSLPYLSIPLVREVLPRVQAAAIVLRHLSFAADTPEARREFATYWASEAVEASCHLAFEIGDNQNVADMIELMAATPALRVAGPSLLITAPPRIRGMAAAYELVEKDYGVRISPAS